MCGRYVQASSPTLLAAHFGIEEIRIPETEPDDAYPRYNVAPRAEMPIVAVSKDVRVLDRVRWGLVPFWAKDAKIGDRQINARAESVATKPAFRRAFEKRRCIVPADGFYEWQAIDRADAAEPRTQRGSQARGAKQKQPWFIHRTDGEPFAFAGLWERWGDDDLRTFAIITTDANDALTPIHHRMPVVLPEAEWERWLDPAFRDTAALQDVLVPLPDAEVEAWPVSTLVNKADNDTPDLTTRVQVTSG